MGVDHKKKKEQVGRSFTVRRLWGGEREGEGGWFRDKKTMATKPDTENKQKKSQKLIKTKHKYKN